MNTNDSMYVKRETYGREFFAYAVVGAAILNPIVDADRQAREDRLFERVRGNVNEVVLPNHIVDKEPDSPAAITIPFAALPTRNFIVCDPPKEKS